MKHLLLLLYGWDASLSQGCSQRHVADTYLYTWVERENVEQCLFSKKNNTNGETRPRSTTFRFKVQCATLYETTPPPFSIWLVALRVTKEEFCSFCNNFATCLATCIDKPHFATCLAMPTSALHCKLQGVMQIVRENYLVLQHPKLSWESPIV